MIKTIKTIFFITLVLIAVQSKSQIRYDNGGLLGSNSTMGEYEVQGNKWNHKFITYFFQNTTNDINSSAAKQAVRNAMMTWQGQTHLYFIEVCNAAQADIIIYWANGDHGDGSPFDGPFGVLAHAYYPPPNSGSLAGDVHFDEAETWTDAFQSGGPQPVDLETVALHEIGH